MDNYLFINGIRVPLSQETVGDLIKAPHTQKSIQFPNKRIKSTINNNFIASIQSEHVEKDKKISKDRLKPGHEGSICLDSLYGTWYMENGQECRGYLYWREND